MTAQQPFDPRVFWETRFQKELSLASASWWHLGLAFNTWMYRLRRDVFLRTVVPGRIDLERTRVLEIGPGPGFYVELWHALGLRRLTALEFSSIVVRTLQPRFPAYEFRHGDITAPLPPDLAARFDLVTAIDVLFHIVDDDKYAVAWRNLAAAMAPGGRLIVTENFLHGGRRVNQTQVDRSRDEIERVAAAAGLCFVSRRPAFVVFNASVDGEHPVLNAVWNAGARVARRGRRWGYAAGAALYAMDALLTRVFREGPSSEIAELKAASSVPGS